jgi:hypothetical protein
MNLLPQRTYLGKLQITEVYEATDEPCLFACQNAAGHLFLAVLLDETDEVKEWLYVSLSAGRLAQVRSGEVDLHDGFQQAEDGFVNRVKVPIYEGESRLETIDCAALSDEMLPIVGERLNLVAQVA